MPTKCLAALAAACAALAVTATEPVLADGMPQAAPARTVVRTVRHAPRVRLVGAHYLRGPWPGGPDPYAYSYERPGYYPHYNSPYWVPRRQMLGRTNYPLRTPEYYSSWGYPLACRQQGRRHCGTPYRAPRGNPHHYYRRDAQMPRPPHLLRHLVSAPN